MPRANIQSNTHAYFDLIYVFVWLNSISDIRCINLELKNKYWKAFAFNSYHFCSPKNSSTLNITPLNAPKRAATFLAMRSRHKTMPQEFAV